MPITSGIINVNKPQGFTSSDVVVVVKGILRCAFNEKKFKVGHLGTLDPLGTGVLPISVGQATKLFDFFQKTSKVYIAGLRINETTDTLDSSGKITANSNIFVSKEQVSRVLEEFKGEILQIPPQYSALCVGGKRAYDIARSGGEVELAARKVTIYNIELCDDESRVKYNIGAISKNFCEKNDSEKKSAQNGDYRSEERPESGEPRPNTEKNIIEFDLMIECSSGTYIRSIMRDIAEKLGGVGYMSYIRRIKAHTFDIATSVTLDDLKTDPLAFLTPIERVLENMPRYEFTDEEHAKFTSGAVVSARLDSCGDELFACWYEGRIIGLATINNGYILSSARLYENQL